MNHRMMKAMRHSCTEKELPGLLPPVGESNLHLWVSLALDPSVLVPLQEVQDRAQEGV